MVFAKSCRLGVHPYKGAFSVAVGLALALTAPAVAAEAQVVTTQGSAQSAVDVEALAAAHVELVAFRGKMQAELAEPRAKKPETQAELRARMQEGTVRVLKAHGLTETEFARLTRQVSTDDALRKQFEAAVAKMSSGNPGQ